ncbi:MAG: hypothetical protein GW795_04385, partial [Cyanobacteria bacterium]|nr:hypothetical protein [Cyanobacteria bacterium CG_2015-04_32_10]
MYELGAAHKFCTAITVSSANSALFGRNLDYGFQEYLANNSIRNQYQSKGQILFETLGHAGLVGTHTALKRATADDSNQYAITLNERIHGGLRLTLAQMLATKCRPSPSAMIETIKNCKGGFNKVVSCLKKVSTCSTVYYTLIDSNGNSAVIEKNRGKRSHYVRGPERLD